jgi:hypothetical protein
MKTAGIVWKTHADLSQRILILKYLVVHANVCFMRGLPLDDESCLSRLEGESYEASRSKRKVHV